MSILDSLKNVASDAVHELSSAAQGAEKLAQEGIDLLLKRPAAPQTDAAQTQAAKPADDAAFLKPADATKAAENTTSSDANKQSTNEGFFSHLGSAIVKGASAALDFSLVMPTIAPPAALVAIGYNIYKNKTSGDTIKVNNHESILSLIPGSNSVFGSSKPASDTTAKTDAAATSANAKDKIFNYIPASEWQKILNTKAQPADSQAGGGGGATATTLPEAKIGPAGVEFRSIKTSDAAKVGDKVGDNVAIDGDKHIHTDKDGTVTTQTANTTEIDHSNGHSTLKDLGQHLVGFAVHGQLTYSENTQTGEQSWMANGYKVVKANHNYNVYDQSGNLIATEPADTLASSVAQQIEHETLANGQRLARHIGGRMLADVNRRLPDSGNVWDVYSDGMSRTLKDGTVIGMTANQDAFVKVSDLTVLYNGQQRQFYVINGNNAPEPVDPAKLGNVSKQEQEALDILETLKETGELEIGDGTFMTVKDGQVTAGQNQIVDEPITAPTNNNTDSPLVDEPVTPPKNDATLETAAQSADQTAHHPKPEQKSVTLATTDAESSTTHLKGGVTETFDYRSHRSTFKDRKGEQIAQIQGENVTTKFVITTGQGTKDRATGDVIHQDGSIKTGEGDYVAANNDISFADGTFFSHDGNIVLANGQVIKGDRETAARESETQQATAAAAQAAAIADSVISAAQSGNLTLSQIAALENSLFQVEGLINRFSGNLEVVTKLMNAEGTIEAGLNSARGALETVKPFNSLRQAEAPRYNDLTMTNRFSFLSNQIAA